VGLVLEEVEMAPTHALGVMHRTVAGAASGAGETATGGEVDADVEPLRLGVEVGAADRPRGVSPNANWKSLGSC
jgi:hypothetical protein